MKDQDTRIIGANADYRREDFYFPRTQSDYSRNICEWERDGVSKLVWARDFLTGIAFILAIWGTWFLTAHLAHWCNVFGACSQ